MNCRKSAHFSTPLSLQQENPKHYRQLQPRTPAFGTVARRFGRTTFKRINCPANTHRKRPYVVHQPSASRKPVVSSKRGAPLSAPITRFQLTSLPAVLPSPLSPLEMRIRTAPPIFRPILGSHSDIRAKRDERTEKKSGKGRNQHPPDTFGFLRCATNETSKEAWAEVNRL